MQSFYAAFYSHTTNWHNCWKIAHLKKNTEYHRNRDCNALHIFIYLSSQQQHEYKQNTILRIYVNKLNSPLDSMHNAHQDIFYLQITMS